MSVRPSVCLSVYVAVCMRAYPWNRWTDLHEICCVKFLFGSPVVVARSSSGGVAIPGRIESDVYECFNCCIVCTSQCAYAPPPRRTPITSPVRAAHITKAIVTVKVRKLAFEQQQRTRQLAVLDSNLLQITPLQ